MKQLRDLLTEKYHAHGMAGLPGVRNIEPDTGGGSIYRLHRDTYRQLQIPPKRWKYIQTGLEEISVTEAVRISAHFKIPMGQMAELARTHE